MHRIGPSASLVFVSSLLLAALPSVSSAQEAAAPHIGLGAGGLEISSADGESTFSIGGRLHADWARHFGDGDVPFDAVDGTEIRRARIALEWTFDRDWSWASQVDFANNDVAVKDFVVEYTGLERVKLSIGNQKQPYNLDLEMSSNDIPFIERGVDNALIEPFVDRAIGVRAESSGAHWFAAAGLFGEPVEPRQTGDEGWAAVGRFVYAPTIEADRVVHLGLRAAYREPSNADTVLIRDETTHFSNLHVVSTGALAGARSVTLFGPEAAYAKGPWSFMGEYNDARIARSGAPDLGFSSWHVSAAYSLGGESRAAVYRIDSGEFKRLRPARDFDLHGGGRGTWELAARYASIDLNDAGTLGGTEKALTLGANWYATSHVRMLLSWTRILDTDGSTPLRASADGVDVVAARAQFSF